MRIPRSQTTLRHELQADKIIALTNAADVELDSIWAALLAKALEGKNVKELLLNVGSGGGGPATAVVTGGATGGAPAAEEKEEEKKEEEKEESDDDMVCSSLFTRSDPCLTGHLSRASVFSINLLEPRRCIPSAMQLHLYLSCSLSIPAITSNSTRSMILHLRLSREVRDVAICAPHTNASGLNVQRNTDPTNTPCRVLPKSLQQVCVLLQDKTP